MVVLEERWPDLAQIIDTRFFALLLTEPHALNTALRATPEEWLHQNPRYLMSRELAAITGTRFGIVDDTVTQEFTRWVEESETPATRDVLGILQGRLRFLLAVGRFDDGNLVADSTLTAIDQAEDTAGFADVVPVVLIRVGLAKLFSGDVSAAIATFSDSVRWSRASGQHPAGRHARHYLALSLALTGDVTQAKKHLLYKPSDVRAEAGTLAYSYETAGVLAHGLIALGSFDEAATTQAVESLDEAIENSELWWIAAHLRARHALYWGERPASITELEGHLVTRRALSGPSSLAGTIIRADLATLYQAVGNLPAAIHVLADPDSDPSDIVLLPARVRLDLLLGHHDQALTRLTSHGLVAGGRDYIPPTLLALKAAAENTLSSRAQTRETLLHAAVTISRTGAIHIVAEAPPEIRTELANLTGIDAATLPDIFPASTRIHLTTREHDVLRALRQHFTVKELALVLHVSPNTAKTHLNSLYRKLSVHTRDQALRVGQHFPTGL